MLFASLIFDREPLQWSQLPDALGVWLQNAGGVSAFGIAMVLAARALQRDANELNLWNFSPSLRALFPALKACIITSGIGYLTLILVWLADRMGIPGLKFLLPRDLPIQPYTIGDWILTLSGVLALFVALTPILIDLTTRISCGRIWAIARLSWKEAIRGRVIWVFGSMALVFLFADWFVQAKPEDQLRSYVRVVYWSMTPLFLITAGLLGSFSIPNDVKNNSIHTIVTKPVEKFEIVLGRFFGYAGLLTIGLFAISCLSLIYVVRGVNEEAKQESYKARVPLYGKLHFVGTKESTRGESVGREFSYRSYITGPTRFKRDAFRQYAIWDFQEIPAHVTQQTEDIIFEFAFDIFRLSKGMEGKGVYCSFTFAAASTDANRQARELEGRTDEMKKRRNKEQARIDKDFDLQKKGKSDAEQATLDEAHQAELKKLELTLIEEFKIFQVTTIEVTDHHTQDVIVLAEQFKKLLAETAKDKSRDEREPMLRVFVSVDMSDEAQMVGVAPHDFYLVTAEKPFWQNFLKGVIGMWCTHMIVLGVAVACSTYLTSVISLLFTMFLFIAGMFVDYLREIAEYRVEGGGPFQSAMRIGAKMSPAAQLDETPTTNAIKVFDNFFSWWIGRVMNLIPDVNRHDLHQYVAHGFDIGWFDILLLDNALPLVGYLAPWAILAYYLMKYREIANPQ